MKTIFSCLWFDGNALEAAEYYCIIFKDAEITSKNEIVVEWKVGDAKFMELNGGPHFKLNEAVSFVVQCKDQEELDYYWNHFVNDGGQESRCGWCKDKFGVSWQVIPENLGSLLSKSPKAMQAMLQMNKMIIKDLEDAGK